ncbi:uncharacterized protein LOC142324738 [Lycorma delicatula]|uniref:uncharacterized protein LOC142324738 n=1 Tax=Lycorma delicatula TaxID=130591 RepID=UPI003F517B05
MCNEGRDSSGTFTGDTSISTGIDRYRGASGGSNSSRLARETQVRTGGGNATSTAGVTCSSSMPQHSQQQQSQQQSQSNMTLDDMMMHNLANHKEKLNTYQDHPQSFLSSTSLNNNRQLAAVSRKLSHDNCSSSIKSDSSKGMAIN